jgi:immunoglobulin-like protein involved in spore germination
MTIRLAATGTALAMAVLAGCGDGGHDADVCADAGQVLSKTAFVFVQKPHSGERVSSGFRVTGCSRTFEGNVIWRLRARDGSTLASGSTQGGAVQAGSFHFDVTYSIPVRQVGLLEVDEPTVTREEGFPPVRNVLPLVLQP